MAKKHSSIAIAGRPVGPQYPPLVIAEIGINHGGSMARAKRMVRDAAKAGAECVKFQVHVVEDEMIPAAKKIVPSHARDSIWEIMRACAFTEKQDRELKKYVEDRKMIYLATPFSRKAAERLHRMGVRAYKIGSGECNNYPLIEHIARYKKPVIISTGMNDIRSVGKSVRILRAHKVPFALLNCTSMYPTPYEEVRLGALGDLKKAFPDAIVGQSDHSLGNFTSLAAVALGASIIEKHFTSDKAWKGPDIGISIEPSELKQLIIGTRAVWEARGGRKTILKGERDIINFAYACVVTTTPIKKGERFTSKNLWVKRPGTGELKAHEYKKVLGRRSRRDLPADVQLKRSDIV